MAPPHPTPAPTLSEEDIQALAPRVLQAVRSVANELRPQARLATGLGLDDSIERDYGLDSLGRVELLARIDRDLGIRLGEAALTEAGTPLIPVTLSGTRSLLRADVWLPERVPITVTIGQFITPAGPGWDHALALRDAARRAMAVTLAEPLLDRCSPHRH
jgi:acyl carrier protein